MSIYTMGIDVGSTSSKCVILKDGQEIVCKSLVASGTGTSGPDRAVAELLEKSGLKKEDMPFHVEKMISHTILNTLSQLRY